MNASSFFASAESREFICDLVDKQCALNLSEEPKIVISAYCAVFLPWGILALLDMISERWKPIRRIIVEGITQLVIAIPTIGYTSYYIHLQRVDRDYKEMCAAIVAVCLSAIHFCRTAWGLWQACKYRKWVKRCLWHLHQHGYKLEDIEEDTREERRDSRLRQFLRDIGVVSFLRKIRLLQFVRYIRRSFQRRKNVMMHSIRNRFCKSSHNHNSQSMSNGYMSDDSLLDKLSWSMYVNNSVIDNEFYECDVPFDINYPNLRHPKRWVSSKDPWLTPRHFTNSCIRYMVPFLAQYGRQWLRDSNEAKKIIGRKDIDSIGHFVKHADILTSGHVVDSDAGRMAANWSNTWSTVLSCHEVGEVIQLENGLKMPFGRKRTGADIWYPWFTSLESTINRFIENLPEVLFETRGQGKAEIIRDISHLDLANFVIFLNSNTLQSSGENRTEAPTLLEVNDAESSGNTKTKEEREGEQEGYLRHNYGDMQQKNITDRAIEEWSYERVAYEKFPAYQDTLTKALRQLLSFDRRFSFLKYPKSTSKNQIVEFTIHLENLFSTSIASKTLCFPETPGNFERHDYSERLGVGRGPFRRLSESEKPRCDFELYYWDLWGLPRCTPPALGDIDVQKHLQKQEYLEPVTTKRMGHVNFTGYIMETVRDGLAKWTEKVVEANMDTNMWSPEVNMSRACVTFTASDEFRKLVMNSNAGFLRFWGRTMWVRLLWECQKHLIEGNVGVVRGPANVELMLLCMLGFPVLEVTSELVLNVQDPGRSTPVGRLRTGVCVTPLGLRQSLKTTIKGILVDGKMTIAMRIVPRDRNRRDMNSFTFDWTEWIHRFEACMKVLANEYGAGKHKHGDGELSEVRNDEEYISHGTSTLTGSSRTKSGGGDVVGVMLNYSESDAASNTEDSQSGTGEEGAEGESDGQPMSDASASDIGDGIEREEVQRDGDTTEARDCSADVEVSCSCTRNRYRLNQKPSRVFIRGTRKFFWDWDGWKAQMAFEKDGYPILHNASSSAGGGNAVFETNTRGETRIPIAPDEDDIRSR